MFYERCSPGRGGERFADAFDAVVQQLEEGVITHRQCFGAFHRVILRGYPYILYYRVRQERAAVVGLLYARMSPETIETLLRARQE
jgi:hypothetical protein